MELLKEVPGYKGIVKAVIQLQIKQLVDLLSEQTGDECIVLVASVPNRTLCHLGTKHGEDYLSGKDQIKREFLQHCLQKYNGETTIKSEVRGDESSESSPNVQNMWKRRRMQRMSPYKTEKKTIGTRKSPKAEDKIVTGQVADITIDIAEDSEWNEIEKETENEMESQSDMEQEYKTKDESVVWEIDTDMEAGQGSVDKSQDEKITDIQTEEFDHLLDEDAELCENIGLSNDQRVSDIGTGQKPEEKFIKGKSLDPDLRTSIILEIIKKGGDVETGYVPRGVYTQVKNMFGLPATSSVTRRWECYIREEIRKKGK